LELFLILKQKLIVFHFKIDMKGTVNKGNKRYFGTAKTEYESKGKRIKKKRNPKDLIGISFNELITSDLYNLPHSGARKLVLLMNYWWKCNGN